jgi:hypothetical protein
MFTRWEPEGMGSRTCLDPLVGAAVRIYEKEATVVSCDSTGTQAPTCHEQTYTVPGATNVDLPGGGTLRGALAASGSTGSDGRFTASGLEAWIYFVIVDGPAGRTHGSAAVLHVSVPGGGTASERVLIPVR